VVLKLEVAGRIAQLLTLDQPGVTQNTFCSAERKSERAFSIFILSFLVAFGEFKLCSVEKASANRAVAAVSPEGCLHAAGCFRITLSEIVSSYSSEVIFVICDEAAEEIHPFLCLAWCHIGQFSRMTCNHVYFKMLESLSFVGVRVTLSLE